MRRQATAKYKRCAFRLRVAYRLRRTRHKTAAFHWPRFSWHERADLYGIVRSLCPIIRWTMQRGALFDPRVNALYIPAFGFARNPVRNNALWYCVIV